MKTSQLIPAFGLLASLAACSSSPKNFSDSIDMTVEKHEDAFNQCYKSAVKQRGAADPMPAGRIEVSFTVNPAGKVTEANILKGIESPKLEKCVQETFRRIQFPSNEEGRLIQSTHPFDFPPSDN